MTLALWGVSFITFSQPLEGDVVPTEEGDLIIQPTCMAHWLSNGVEKQYTWTRMAGRKNIRAYLSLIWC